MKWDLLEKRRYPANASLQHQPSAGHGLHASWGTQCCSDGTSSKLRIPIRNNAHQQDITIGPFGICETCQAPLDWLAARKENDKLIIKQGGSSDNFHIMQISAWASTKFKQTHKFSKYSHTKMNPLSMPLPGIVQQFQRRGSIRQSDKMPTR